MSFACIHVPNFSLQAAIRIDESLRDQAVAIFDGIFPLWTIIALSPKAAQKGLHLGMTKTQAEFFDVKLFRRSYAQEAAAHQALLDCALAISPRVEDTHTLPVKGIGDTVILDTEGLGWLYRSPEKLARKIRQVARQLNLDVNIGIAANPEAAALAAQGFAGVTIIPPGSESKCLGPLPVEILQISAELQETFTTWGIQTLHALSSLPEVGLIKRLGQEGKRLQDLARGVHQRILIPIEPTPKFEECMELETSLELLEPLTFILARLLKQLCARLRARSFATNEVRLVLELEEPSPVISRDTLSSNPAVGDPPVVPPCARVDRRRVSGSLKQEPAAQAPQEQSPLRHSTILNLPVPTNDSKTLLKLLQLDLESRPPVAPVRSVFLKAEATSPRTVQRELFEPASPEPEKLEITLARIAAVVGKDRVGSPVLLNTHKPDNFQLKKFLPVAVGNASRNPPGNPSSRAAAAVRLRGASLGHPAGTFPCAPFKGGLSPIPIPRRPDGTGGSIENPLLRGENAKGTGSRLEVIHQDIPLHPLQRGNQPLSSNTAPRSNMEDSAENFPHQVGRVPQVPEEITPASFLKYEKIRTIPLSTLVEASQSSPHPQKSARESNLTFTSPSPQRGEGSGVKRNTGTCSNPIFSHPPLDKVEPILPRSSLRRFRPPIPVRVRTESATPVVVFFHHERRKILECAGPWRINGDWWTDAPWSRAEWDVTLSQEFNRTAQSKLLKDTPTQETAVYRIYQDLRSRQWFIEGMYD